MKPKEEIWASPPFGGRLFPLRSTSYPDAKGRGFVIYVVLKFRPNGDGARFLELAVEGAAIEFRYGPPEKDYDEEAG